MTKKIKIILFGGIVVLAAGAIFFYFLNESNSNRAANLNQTANADVVDTGNPCFKSYGANPTDDDKSKCVEAGGRMELESQGCVDVNNNPCPSEWICICAVCGNGRCEANEDEANCPDDCN